MMFDRLVARPRTTTKTYGRDSLLIWINPLLSALEAAFGLRIGLRSNADVVAAMERDILAMQQAGYRVIASEEVGLPVLLATRTRATYYRVAYELVDASSARSR
jgi:hypothetical protein